MTKKKTSKELPSSKKAPADGKAKEPLDPECSDELGEGYFRSVLPGKYFWCHFDENSNRWLKRLLDCPEGKEFDNEQQKCL